MDPQTAQRLIELNRTFYATVAEPFNRTRFADAPGKLQLLQHFAMLAPDRTLRVLDVGCGNGRLAWMLDRLKRPVAYTGVDGETRLLALAQENTAALRYVQTQWVHVDLSAIDWFADWSGDWFANGTDTLLHEVSEQVPSHLSEAGGYDAVVCLATLQHMPGFDLRARVLADLGRLVSSDGLIAVSAWQFLQSTRLAAKQLDWQVADIDPAAVEPGDALLPWQQDHYAVRYVHQIDGAEMALLAYRAGLTIESTFFADGREGNLNLYALMRPACMG